MKNKGVQTCFEDKYHTVNSDIRICVNCGNISVQKENYGIYCKECEMFFGLKEDRK